VAQWLELWPVKQEDKWAELWVTWVEPWVIQVQWVIQVEPWATWEELWVTWVEPWATSVEQ
jgi:hypothetical protein